MAMKLFVGSLSFDINDQQLKEAFEAYGTVLSAQIIIDRDSNRSKGFGFVEMSTDDEAKAAIKNLHGAELGGRRLIVNEARPKEDRGPRPAYGGNGGGNRERRY